MQKIKQLLFVIAVLSILFKITYSKAQTTFFVNGKRTDAQSAAMAALDNKNEVLKCDAVSMAINDKGNLKLNKKDNGWTPVTK
jgi:Tfp pilus assembly protein PilE